MKDSNSRIRVRVTAIRMEANDVLSFELRSADFSELPSFSAGSHIDLYLPRGMVRSYSLCSDPSQTHFYTVAVGLDVSSRGGSRHLHSAVKVGEYLEIGQPRNNFELNEAAAHTVLVAGGIGITPLWCMAQRLTKIGKPWQLLYAARSVERSAFVPQLLELAQNSGCRVTTHFDEARGAQVDLDAYLASVPVESEVYCCGPGPMLRSFEASAAKLFPAHQIHVEHFRPVEKVQTTGLDSFVVELRKTGKILSVPPDKSLLDVLLDDGMDVSYSCTEGICGVCKVQVLEGIPDHRDFVLSAEERSANEVMLLCCSRAMTPRLVLDL